MLIAPWLVLAAAVARSVSLHNLCWACSLCWTYMLSIPGQQLTAYHHWVQHVTVHLDTLSPIDVSTRQQAVLSLHYKGSPSVLCLPCSDQHHKSFARPPQSPTSAFPHTLRSVLHYVAKVNYSVTVSCTFRLHSHSWLSQSLHAHTCQSRLIGLPMLSSTERIVQLCGPTSHATESCFQYT